MRAGTITYCSRLENPLKREADQSVRWRARAPRSIAAAGSLPIDSE
jgi:hypothetical protein